MYPPADQATERFWPAHPLDDGIGDGHTSFYFGAAGMIWRIDYLARVGATRSSLEGAGFEPSVPVTLDA